MEKTLATIKVGLRMQSTHLGPTKPPITGNISVSYPFGKIIFSESKLLLEFEMPGLFKDLMPNVITMYELEYSDIESIKRGLLYIRIFHRQPGLSKYIYIHGIAFPGSIFKQIISCTQKNNLPVVVDKKIAPFL